MDGGDEYVPDKDWISRRWQGEGKVVRREPKPTGPPPLKAARTAGDAGFTSGLGAHCASCGRAGWAWALCYRGPSPKRSLGQCSCGLR